MVPHASTSMLMTHHQESEISICCQVQNEEYGQRSLLPWNQDHLHSSWHLLLMLIHLELVHIQHGRLYADHN